MDFLSEILNSSDQNAINELIDSLSSERNFDFFEQAINYALDTQNPTEKRIQSALLAKNYLRERSVDAKVSNFREFNEKPKELRARLFNQIFAQIDEIPTFPQLLAVLLEADSLNKGGLSLHNEIITSLLERCTQNSYFTLEILFEDSSFSSIQTLVFKQREIIDKLFGAIMARPEESFVSICLHIVKKLIKNIPHLCEQICQVLVEMLEEYCSSGQIDGKAIGDILDVFVEINKQKPEIIVSNLSVIYNNICGIYQVFTTNQSLTVQMQKIVFFFMQMDQCKYEVNDMLVSGVLIPILMANCDEQLKNDAFECLIEFTQHTYIKTTEVDPSIVPFKEELTGLFSEIEQLDPNVMKVIAAFMPAFIHKDNIALLTEICQYIINVLINELQTKNIQFLQNSGVIFVKNFINYAPIVIFSEFQEQIEEIVEFMVSNIENIQVSLELFESISFYLQKLYVIQSTDFAEIFGELHEEILLNLSLLIEESNPRIVYIVEEFMQVEFCNFLFKQEIRYILTDNLENVTLEASKFLPQEIIVKKELIERLKTLEIVELDSNFAIEESLEAMNLFTVNFFNLLQSLEQAAKNQIFFLFEESCLANLCQIIETFTNGLFKDNFFLKPQPFTLENVLDLYNNNFQELITIFESDIANYHDCFCRTYDCYTRIAQILLITGQQQYYQNLKFLIPILSLSAQSPQSLIHVNSCELLANLVPLMDDQEALQIYQFAIQQLQQDLLPMSRGMLTVIIQSYLERPSRLVDNNVLYQQILELLIKNATFLNSANNDQKTTELCIDTMQLAGVFFTTPFVTQLRVKQSDMTMILKFVFSYLQNVDLNFELKEIGLAIELHMVYGAINASQNSRNVLVQPDVHRIVKETISICSSSQDELVENVLHVFMQDYNLVMQGKK